jgi:hypothetical protein
LPVRAPSANAGSWPGSSARRPSAPPPRALSLSQARFHRTLAQRIAATWRVTEDLERFGAMVDVDLAAVQDTQLSATPAELFAIGGMP